MKQQRKEKITTADLDLLTTTGLSVVQIPHVDHVSKETSQYTVSKIDDTGNEEFSEIFTETELIEMLKIFKII